MIKLACGFVALRTSLLENVNLQQRGTLDLSVRLLGSSLNLLSDLDMEELVREKRGKLQRQLFHLQPHPELELISNPVEFRCSCLRLTSLSGPSSHTPTPGSRTATRAHISASLPPHAGYGSN